MLSLYFCIFFFYYYGDHTHLHSFPTRRSSDLDSACNRMIKKASNTHAHACELAKLGLAVWNANPSVYHEFDNWMFLPATRSEEHTSELQSQSNLVCRLLLEKKNTKISMI